MYAGYMQTSASILQRPTLADAMAKASFVFVLGNTSIGIYLLARLRRSREPVPWASVLLCGAASAFMWLTYGAIASANLRASQFIIELSDRNAIARARTLLERRGFRLRQATDHSIAVLRVDESTEHEVIELLRQNSLHE
jgi:hypothetical protein